MSKKKSNFGITTKTAKTVFEEIKNYRGKSSRPGYEYPHIEELEYNRLLALSKRLNIEPGDALGMIIHFGMTSVDSDGEPVGGFDDYCAGRFGTYEY